MVVDYTDQLVKITNKGCIAIKRTNFQQGIRKIYFFKI